MSRYPPAVKPLHFLFHNENNLKGIRRAFPRNLTATESKDQDKWTKKLQNNIEQENNTGQTKLYKQCARRDSLRREIVIIVSHVRTAIFFLTKFCQALIPIFKGAVVLPQSRTKFCQASNLDQSDEFATSHELDLKENVNQVNLIALSGTGM